MFGLHHTITKQLQWMSFNVYEHRPTNEGRGPWGLLRNWLTFEWRSERRFPRLAYFWQTPLIWNKCTWHQYTPLCRSVSWSSTVKVPFEFLFIVVKLSYWDSAEKRIEILNQRYVDKAVSEKVLLHWLDRYRYEYCGKKVWKICSVLND